MMITEPSNPAPHVQSLCGANCSHRDSSPDSTRQVLGEWEASPLRGSVKQIPEDVGALQQPALRTHEDSHLWLEYLLPNWLTTASQPLG